MRQSATRLASPLVQACGSILLAALAVAGVAVLRHRDDPAVAVASEAAIAAERPTRLLLRRWDRDPAVLVLDFPGPGGQGRMLNRVAALVEKRDAPRDRVLDDAGLAQAIARSGATPATYYAGHDYAAADLRRFFALADRDHVRLNRDEALLRRLLRRLGWTEGGPDGGRDGALVSLSAASGPLSAAMRAAILHHELSHGAFFTLRPYADWSRRFWQRALTPAERAGFRAWLAGQGYDPALEPLMLDEAQAYLVWTPDRAFFRPEQAGLTAARAAALRADFLQGLPPAVRVEDPAVP